MFIFSFSFPIEITKKKINIIICIYYCILYIYTYKIKYNKRNCFLFFRTTKTQKLWDSSLFLFFLKMLFYFLKKYACSILKNNKINISKMNACAALSIFIHFPFKKKNRTQRITVIGNNPSSCACARSAKHFYSFPLFLKIKLRITVIGNNPCSCACARA